MVRAVTGTVGANELQDFDITWLWEYYQSDERDQMDTALGNKAAWEIPDEVQAGLYIVVVENSEPNDPHNPGPENPDLGDPDSSDPNNPDTDKPYTYPEVPQTGDSSRFEIPLILMLVSGMLFLLLMLERRKEK